jgi:molybdopterin synthase catalytic subunit
MFAPERPVERRAAPERPRERSDRASVGAGPLDQPYDGVVLGPTDDTWLGLVDGVLPVAAAYDWASRPDCGAVVLFSGTARDHSPGRDGVEVLEYEAYDEQVVPRLSAIAADARIRWSTVRRIALIHRTGVVPVGESAVIAVVSAPHRDEAFAAARFCIDALKATVPIWKREEWSGGASWGLEQQHITEVDQLGGATA